MESEKQKQMLKAAHDYASKQGFTEYESSFEDFIQGYKAALNIPLVSYCSCSEPHTINTVYPLLDICNYCRKAIKE